MALRFVMKAKVRAQEAELSPEQELEKAARTAMAGAAEIKKINELIAQLNDKKIPHQAALEAFSNKLDEMNHHPDDEWKIEFEDIAIDVKKKGTKREIADIEKIKKMLGQKTFMKIATIGLGDVDKYLNPEQKAEVLNVERVQRSFKFRDIS